MPALSWPRCCSAKQAEERHAARRRDRGRPPGRRCRTRRTSASPSHRSAGSRPRTPRRPRPARSGPRRRRSRCRPRRPAFAAARPRPSSRNAATSARRAETTTRPSPSPKRSSASGRRAPRCRPPSPTRPARPRGRRRRRRARLRSSLRSAAVARKACSARSPSRSGSGMRPGHRTRDHLLVLRPVQRAGAGADQEHDVAGLAKADAHGELGVVEHADDAHDGRRQDRPRRRARCRARRCPTRPAGRGRCRPPPCRRSPRPARSRSRDPLGLPKLRQLVTAAGRAPVQATLRAASQTALMPPRRGSSQVRRPLPSRLIAMARSERGAARPRRPRPGRHHGARADELVVLPGDPARGWRCSARRAARAERRRGVVSGVERGARLVLEAAGPLAGELVARGVVGQRRHRDVADDLAAARNARRCPLSVTSPMTVASISQRRQSASTARPARRARRWRPCAPAISEIMISTGSMPCSRSGTRRGRRRGPPRRPRPSRCRRGEARPRPGPAATTSSPRVEQRERALDQLACR